VSQSDAITLDELFEEFEELDDWDDQCDYLIDLGYELPPLPDSMKREENRVHGCQSNVWLVADVKPGDSPVVEFMANSDAIIVSGLIAVLTIMYSGKTAEEILKIDAREVFGKLGLERHLSSQRRNGLFGMVKRIRKIAFEAIAS
jgi:cysteine desulfuration protein SufE